MSARTVLVIEDDPSFAQLIKVYLEADGWRVHTALTGADALNAAGAARQDLIVLDLTLPDVSGEALLQALRSTPGCTAPALVVTMLDLDTAERARLTALGAAGFLRKGPGVGRMVAAAGATMLAGGRAPGPNLGRP